MASVLFHRLAIKEYRSSRSWYRSRDPKVADRFRDAVDLAVERLQASPEAYPIIAGEVRGIRVRRFPFQLIYRRQSQDSILILAVAHTSRRSGYWRRRQNSQ